MVKSKPKALRQFKVDPVLKIDETVYKARIPLPKKPFPCFKLNYVDGIV